MHAVVALLLSLIFPSASAEVSHSTCRPIDGAICSKTFAADGTLEKPGEVVAILETPWEDRPIAIVGLGMAFAVERPWFRSLFSSIKCAAFVGNSYQPDVMLWEGGTGSITKMFGASGFFPFPGNSEPEPPHVDMHVFCSDRAQYSAKLIVYYRLR